jgi:hypothetical protein
MRKLRGLRKIQYFKTLLKWREQLQKNNKETRNLCVAILEETTKLITCHEPKRGPIRMG